MNARAAQKTLRIAHVTATFPPYKGGTGNVVWHLARELANRGSDVHVLTAERGGPTLAPPGVAVHRLRPLVRVGNAPALPTLVPNLREYDLIHLHYPFFFGAESVWTAAAWFGIPYVVTYHHDVRLPGALMPVPHLYRWAIGNRVLADAKAILFTTLDYARSSDAAWLAERSTALELPLGVQVERFSPDAADSSVREKLGIQGDQVVALFVASLDRAHHFKGLPTLLQAMKLLDDLPVRLVVVGDGDLEAEYQQQASQLGLSERVSFAGAVSDAELSQLYSSCDMLVVPSITRGEAFGLVILEAMASGKPVIASELPGVREVVARAGGGLLVPPGDSMALAAEMRTLACSPQRRAQLGRTGRTAVENAFNWPSIVDRLEVIYSSVTGKAGARQWSAT